MTRASRLTRVLAVIGAVAIVAALAGVVVAVGVVRRGFSARPEPSAAEEWLALKVRKLAVPERYRTMKNPATLDDATRRDAMAHWADHCAGCHANDGSGETSMGQLMYPRPPDMRKARTQDLSDGELYYAINQGIRLIGMPAWGEPGDDDLGSWELVGFIRALSTLTPAQLDEMKTMNPVPASRWQTAACTRRRSASERRLRQSDPPAVASGAGRAINSIMRDGPSKIALVLVALFSPLIAFAQQGMPMGRDGMMWCSPYGAGGTVLTVLVALLLLAATAALIAFTVFLLQRNRPRAPLDT